MKLTGLKEETILKQKPPQASFYGAYLYDRIVPTDHLLRKINQVVDFSFVHHLVKDRYTPDFGRPVEDPEFMLSDLRRKGASNSLIAIFLYN